MQPITLDSRIDDISDVQSVLRYSKDYIKSEGYFTNSIEDLYDLDKCHRGFLESILEYCWREGDEIFVTNSEKGDKLTFRYFIPLSLLKGVRYKPLDISLFVYGDIIRDGGFVRFREKGNDSKIAELRYNGWSKDGNLTFVHLGSIKLTFEKLLSDYEYEQESYPGHWLPFGIEETNTFGDSDDEGQED